MTYRWLTNLRTPVDDTDGRFLDTLADYRLGPPRVAVEQENHVPMSGLIENGVVGVYTTEEAMANIKSMTGWSKRALSDETLVQKANLFHGVEFGA